MKCAAVLIVLFLAVHVSAGPVPAPVPVLLVFAAVLAGLCWCIWKALARGGSGLVPCPYRSAVP